MDSTGTDNRKSKLEESFIFPYAKTLQNLKYWPSCHVPVVAQANEYVPELCRVPYDYLFRDDPVAMAECTLLVHEYTGFDVLAANLDIYNFEAESIGAKMRFFKNHLPDIDRSDFFIKDKVDLEKIRFRGLDSGRYGYLLKYQAAYTEYCGLPISTQICAPWTIACNLFGVDNLLVSIMTEPEFAHELLERIVEDLLAPVIIALSGVLEGFSKASLADAFASVPLITNEIAEEYVEKYNDLLSLRLESHGIKVTSGGYWGVALMKDEEINRFLDFKIRAGGSLSAQDPDVSSLGLRFFRDYATEKGVDLKLGMSSAFLQAASPIEISEKVKEFVLIGKDGPTSLTFTLNNICPHTPPENVHSAVAALRTYGDPYATAKTEFIPPEIESFRDFLIKKIKDNKAGYTFEWLKKSALSGVHSQL